MSQTSCPEQSAFAPQHLIPLLTLGGIFFDNHHLLLCSPISGLRFALPFRKNRRAFSLLCNLVIDVMFDEPQTCTRIVLARLVLSGRVIETSIKNVRARTFIYIIGQISPVIQIYLSLFYRKCAKKR